MPDARVGGPAGRWLDRPEPHGRSGTATVTVATVSIPAFSTSPGTAVSARFWACRIGRRPRARACPSAGPGRAAHPLFDHRSDRLPAAGAQTGQPGLPARRPALREGRDDPDRELDLRLCDQACAGDPVLTAATLDRLLHYATVVSIQGKSYRLNDKRRRRRSSHRHRQSERLAPVGKQILWGGRRPRQHRRWKADRWSAAMPKPNDLSRSHLALDEASTLIVVIAMRLATWLVAGRVPGVDRSPLRKQDPDPDSLLARLHRWRDEAVRAGHSITRIAAAFEAGRDGRVPPGGVGAVGK